MSWLREQWNDIKGNVKYGAITLVLSPLYALFAHLARVLPPWEQIAAWTMVAVFVSWALIAVRVAGSRRSPAARAPLEFSAGRIDLPADAPQLLIRFLVNPQRGETLEFINDGSNAIVDLQLGPVTWHEQRSIQLGSGVGTLFAGSPERRTVCIERSPSHFSSLCEFIRTGTPHDAETSVTVAYQDSKGRRFSRDFLLTTLAEGGMIFAPGPVKLFG
jgi:hypothetical protein